MAWVLYHYYHHQTLLFSVSISLFILKIGFVVCSVARSVKLLHILCIRIHRCLWYFDSWIVFFFRLRISNVEVFLNTVPKLQPWAIKRISNTRLCYWTLNIVKMERLAFGAWNECKIDAKIILQQKDRMLQRRKYLRYIHIFLNGKEWTKSSNTSTSKRLILDLSCRVYYYYRIICSIFLLFLFYIFISHALYSKLYTKLYKVKPRPDSRQPKRVSYTDIFQFT